MSENHTTPWQARDQGRNAALAGREIFVNPHTGVDAEAWFRGYREVPEAERGSRPDLLSKARATKKLARAPRGRAIGRGMQGTGICALGDKCLPGSRTPKPWTEV